MGKLVEELTDLQVRKQKHALNAAGNPCVAMHAVGGVQGLYIKCSPPNGSNATGAKSWILRATIGGKRRELGLGSYPTVTLKQARELARDKKTSIASGIDPLAEARAKKSALLAQRAKEITFRDLAEEFVLIKTREWKTAKQVGRLRQYLRDYAYPAIGELFVRDIRREHLIQMLKPIWEDKNPTATRLINYVEKIIQKGIVDGHRDGFENPALWKGNLELSFPKASKIHKVKHQRAVDWRLMPQFMNQLQQLDDPIGSRPDVECLSFMILTIARPSEARMVNWEDVDLESRVWTIRADSFKSHYDWQIPLTSQAISLLKAIPHRSGRIFRTLNGREIPDNYLSSLPDALGFDGVAHGFRTSFRTWGQEQQRFSEEALELCLKHVDTDATRAAYARSQLFDERKKILNAYEKWLFSGGFKNENILSFQQNKTVI